MPKYRYLSDDELQTFEEEFKQFLIVNHVYKEEWERINREQSDLALELVGLFSDQVLQRIYENIRYVEKQSKDSCFVFHFGADKLELIALQLKEDAPDEADLGSPESIHQTLKHFAAALTYFKHEKGYTLGREQEIHQLFEQGALISSAEFWNSLNNIL